MIVEYFLRWRLVHIILTIHKACDLYDLKTTYHWISDLETTGLIIKISCEVLVEQVNY